jgi:hypothetical protein
MKKEKGKIGSREERLKEVKRKEEMKKKEKEELETDKRDPRE